MGFQPDIKRILNYLPPKDKRQTLLFTATVPAGVREIGEAFLRPDSEYVDAVHEDESESHAHIDHRFQVRVNGRIMPCRLRSLLKSVKQDLSLCETDRVGSYLKQMHIYICTCTYIQSPPSRSFPAVTLSTPSHV